MDSTKDHYKLLLQAMLPEEIFNYFEITQVIIDEKRLDVHLDELHESPEEYLSEKLTSKGFQSAVIIQDFPIRERMVYLHVRKRKWLVIRHDRQRFNLPAVQAQPDQPTRCIFNNAGDLNIFCIEIRLICR